MTTPLWTRLAGASVGATLMACATPTYDRSTTLPVPASVVASATLNGMGYSALGYASESDFQSTTVSWVALREGREDRLLVRMITHFASGGTPPYGSGEVLLGYGISIRARSYITDGSGQRRPVQPSAAVKADADSLIARVRATLPVERRPSQP